MWSWIGEIDAEQWSAAAAWLTAGVAVIAGVVAISQLGKARRLRVEQAAPYVVASIDANPVSVGVVDFVVKNFGSTTATDVQVTASPPLRRVAGSDEPEPVAFPQVIPVLVPGQKPDDPGGLRPDG